KLFLARIWRTSHSFRVFKWLDAFITRLLGPAADLGASSWLQAFTWAAAVVAVVFAGVSLRRNSLQARAALLLNLYKSWEELAEERKEFSAFFHATRIRINEKHANMKEEFRIEQMRQDFQQQLTDLRDSKDPKFTQFTSYISFFELVGMYVKNGY